MTANFKVTPQISDVSLINNSEFDCIMSFGGQRYVCWGLFKLAPGFELQLTHLSMNKMGARGANHVSKIETFSPFIVQSVTQALKQNVNADFVALIKEHASE